MEQGNRDDSGGAAADAGSSQQTASGDGSNDTPVEQILLRKLLGTSRLQGRCRSLPSNVGQLHEHL